MQINNMKALVYWRKTYSVEAIRLTPDNIQVISDYLGAEFCVKSAKEPYIDYGGDEGHIGEWLVESDGNRLFYSHEDFLQAFKTHAEEMSTNERYAKIFQLVASAMSKQDSATFNQDTDGIDLVAIETTKRIMGEL